MENDKDVYREALQALKNDIFNTFLEYNNIWMTLRQISERVQNKNPNHKIPIKNAIEDQDKRDEYQIECSDKNKIDVSSKFAKYRLKTEDILNKEQLEEYFKDKKCIVNVNRRWFESCYPEMKQDLAQLESEGKILINSSGVENRQYVYVDTLFKNFQEKKVFKEDVRIQKFLEEAKSKNQSTVNSLNDKKNVLLMVILECYYKTRVDTSNCFNIKLLDRGAIVRVIKKMNNIINIIMGSGTSRQMSIPIVYQEQNKYLSGLKSAQKQKQTIPKPYLKIDPNYSTIGRLETINSPVVHGAVGLKNLGNTCYFNAAIHCVSHTQPLVDYFLSKAYKINSQCPTGGNVTKQFLNLIEQIWDDEHCFSESRDFKKLTQGQKLKPFINSLNPVKLLNLLQKYSKRFAIGVQEDCQELLSYLLDLLHQELNRSHQNTQLQTRDYTGAEINPEWAAQSWGDHLKVNRSIIVDLFQGQLKSTCKCITCGFQSHKWEPFLFLNLPIPKQRSNIYECLNLFQKPEILSGSCQWRCPECQINRDFEKSIQLWKLPNQLIIHLKRFEYNHKKQVKLNTIIDFPFELEMDQYCVEQAISSYQLYAIALHQGSSYNGHYMAVCRAHNNNWFMYNDETVYKVQDLKKILQSEYAYMLFYQRYDAVCRQTLNKPEMWPHFRLPTLPFKSSLIVQTERNYYDTSPAKLTMQVRTSLDNSETASRHEVNSQK